MESRKRSPEFLGVPIPQHWHEEIQRQAQDWWQSGPSSRPVTTEAQQFRLLNNWYRGKVRAIYNDTAEFKIHIYNMHNQPTAGWKWRTAADYGRDIIRQAFNLPELVVGDVKQGRPFSTGKTKEARARSLIRLNPKVSESLANLGKTYRYMSNSKETDGEIANKILQAGIDAKLQRLHAIKGATS